MRHILAFCALALALSSGSGMAQTTPPETRVATTPVKQRIISREEFYYFSANGLRMPLRLAPSVVVRFRGQKTVTSIKHLERYAPLAIKDIQSTSSGAEFALEFIPGQDASDMVRILQRIAADATLDSAPVFIVDGMEAVVDGMYIQTTTPMAGNTVKAALEELFGEDMALREITPENGTWHVSFKNMFFLGDKKIPLHALSLANLTNTSNAVWVKRAYPKFAFLHAPVIATVSVTPVSGTVGEKRTVTLGVRIFGKEGDVVIETTDIPELMQGTFAPVALGKLPQTSFWEVSDLQKSERRQVGPNEWYLEHRYTMGLYAPETEWSIPSFQIPYQYKGIPRVASVRATTFFVRPHIDERYKLEDMPEAYLFPTIKPQKNPRALPSPEHAWFDVIAKPLGGRKALKSVLWVSIAASGILIALALTELGVRIAPRMFSGTPDTYKIRLEELYEKARKEKGAVLAMQYLHDALSHILHAYDSRFPENNVTYQDVKKLLETHENKKAYFIFTPEGGFEKLFEHIESRNARGFAKQDSVVLRTIFDDTYNTIKTLALQLDGKRGA
ncbi:MAG TPA: hypothetical protein VJH33_00220 [Candidatus Paceibacterota bacterium]